MSNNPVLEIFEHIVQRSIPFHILFNPHQNVSSMTVCMHEVVLHQHFEKCTCPQHCDCFIEFVRVIRVKRNRKSFGKCFDQYFIVSFRKRQGEFNIWISEYFIILFEVFALSRKINLINQYFLERLVVYWNLKFFR